MGAVPPPACVMVTLHSCRFMLLRSLRFQNCLDCQSPLSTRRRCGCYGILPYHIFLRPPRARMPIVRGRNLPALIPTPFGRDTVAGRRARPISVQSEAQSPEDRSVSESIMRPLGLVGAIYPDGIARLTEVRPFIGLKMRRSAQHLVPPR